MSGVRYVLPLSPLAVLLSHLSMMLTRPVAFWGALAYLLSRPHAGVRERLRTVGHFGEGVHVAWLLRDGESPPHLHAHFVDRAALVALVASRLLSGSYSATAHANDIYVRPVMLAEKIGNARFIVTCTHHNLRHLRTAVRVESVTPMVCIHHGLDLGRYGPRPSDGRTGRPIVILAVGQLKAKKGFGDLISACKLLRDRGVDFACEIVGEGPLRKQLTEQIRSLELEGTVSLLGGLDHDDVIARYRSADLFCLPCVTDADGDRDGIPNVVLEAMAMQLPVVSTRHSGIPEAVAHGSSGTLVAPGDPEALASALAELVDEESKREEMGRKGAEIVAMSFDVTVNAKELLSHFEQVAGL